MALCDEPTDHDLLDLVRRGDEEAFVTLYRRRSGPLYRFALKMSGTATVAEEVTQEVFLLIAREPDRFDPSQGTLAAFLFGVARNLVLRRNERGRVFVSIDGAGGEPTAHESLIDRRDPHGELDRNERIERVRRAVTSLPAHYREVVVLCDLEELSYIEAADALGCSVGTIRSRLHRARSILQERLRTTEQATDVGDSAATKRCFA